jgi:cell shape-determining protein MreD
MVGWIIGINGNTVVDQEVKDKLYDTIDILHTLNLNVLKYIFKRYQKTIYEMFMQLLTVFLIVILYETFNTAIQK